VSRPIYPSHDPRLRWWGNVRIASKPVDGTSFANLSGVAKGLKTNELAQAAEYLSGLDIRLTQIRKALLGESEDSRQRFVFSLVLGGGASGSLTNQTVSPVTFSLPAGSSPSLAPLTSFYPTLKNSTAPAFIVNSPVERYAAEYWGGFRVTTRYADKYGVPQRTPPAMVLFAVGQSEAVTPGVLRGVVGRFETFYPMLTHNSNALFSSLYLFGTAQIRFGGTKFPALNLQQYQPPQGTTLDLSTLPTVFDRVTRDQYSVGVGLDLVNVLSRAKITFK